MPKGKTEDSKSTTHVLVVTDKSGSMFPFMEETIEGFNSYIQGLKDAAKKDENLKFRVSVTLFNHEVFELCKGVKLKDVPEFTKENYNPLGYTALLDAVGRTLGEFEKITLGKNDKVLVLIQTDGQENWSKEYGYPMIQKMIQDRDALENWTFIFMGSDSSVWSQAQSMGLRMNSVVGTHATGKGTADAYRGMTVGSVAYAAAPVAMAAPAVSGLIRSEVDGTPDDNSADDSGSDGAAD